MVARGRSCFRRTTFCPRRLVTSCFRPQVPWRCSLPVPRSRSGYVSTPSRPWFGLLRAAPTGPTRCRWRGRRERAPLANAAWPRLEVALPGAYPRPGKAPCRRNVVGEQGIDAQGDRFSQGVLLVEGPHRYALEVPRAARLNRVSEILT